MDILDIIFNALLFYIVFKLGEHFAYVKLSHGILKLKDRAQESIEKIESVLTVEKINNQYYAYMNNNFVGQGQTLDEVTQVITDSVRKNPSRYASVKVTLKD